MKYARYALGTLLAFSSVQSWAESKTDVICSYAPSQSKVVAQITAGAGGAGLGVAAIMKAAGISAVAHSSGGYILTGSGGYIAGTLGGAVAAPTVMTVSVVVAGSVLALELVCAPRTHPSAVAKVKEISADLERQLRSRVANGELDAFQQNALAKLRAINDRAIDTRDAAIHKVLEANAVAIDYRDMAFGYFSK